MIGTYGSQQPGLPRRGALPPPFTTWEGEEGAREPQQASKVVVLFWPKTMLRGTAPGSELEAELAAAEGSLGVSDQVAP